MYFPCLLHVTTLPQGVLDSLKGIEQTLSTLSLSLSSCGNLEMGIVLCYVFLHKQTTENKQQQKGNLWAVMVNVVTFDIGKDVCYLCKL